MRHWLTTTTEHAIVFLNAIALLIVLIVVVERRGRWRLRHE
jgi:hypothetical protein